MKQLQKIFEKAKKDIPKMGTFFVTSKQASKKQKLFLFNINLSFLQQWKITVSQATFDNTILYCINDPDSPVYGIDEMDFTEDNMYTAFIFFFCKECWWYCAHLTDSNKARNLPPVEYIFKK